LRCSIVPVRYFAYIAIERKEAILDPQGKAVHHALGSLGFRELEDARIGKLVRLTLDAPTTDAARAIAERASEKLLANPIMETYSVIQVSEEPILRISEREITQ
jgi:phosphoribosylformylglycinamidine synthase subunit PurS